MANLDPARYPATFFRYLIKQSLIMGFVRTSVFRCEFFEDRLTLVTAIIVDLAVTKGQVSDGAVIEDLGFTGIS